MTAATMTMSEPKMVDQHRGLSPNAPAFHPYFEPCHIAIYNEGMPSLTLTTEQDRFKILHGIQDEALDEGFPPDADDAAELDAVDAYVEEMALLAFMEEQEQMAREGFVHIKKRWEARRKEGLKGRPHPAKHLFDKKTHTAVHHDAFAVNCKSLVSYSHHNHGNQKPHQLEVPRHDPAIKQKGVAMAQKRSVIQQPRKQY
jgi:hypothetical protein